MTSLMSHEHIGLSDPISDLEEVEADPESERPPLFTWEELVQRDVLGWLIGTGLHLDEQPVRNVDEKMSIRGLLKSCLTEDAEFKKWVEKVLEEFTVKTEIEYCESVGIGLDEPIVVVMDFINYTEFFVEEFCESFLNPFLSSYNERIPTGVATSEILPTCVSDLVAEYAKFVI